MVARRECGAGLVSLATQATVGWLAGWVAVSDDDDNDGDGGGALRARRGGCAGKAVRCIPSGGQRAGQPRRDVQHDGVAHPDLEVRRRAALTRRQVCNRCAPQTR